MGMYDVMFTMTSAHKEVRRKTNLVIIMCP